jgi:phage repressor protein C with HTH and peptisase S24 domain
MGWATRAHAALTQGETVHIRPRGHSMSGRINDGDLVTVAPCDASSVRVGDAVFVRMHGGFLLHLVKAIQGDRVLIGNNRGKINGWVNKNAVIGKVIRVDPA